MLGKANSFAMLTQWERLAATCPASMWGAQVQNRMILLRSGRRPSASGQHPSPTYSTAENTRHGLTHSQDKVGLQVDHLSLNLGFTIY